MDPDYVAALLEALFSRPPIGLQVLDTELRIVRFNTSAPAARGISASEAQGRTWREEGFVAADVEQMLRRVLATGEPVSDYRYEGPLPRGPGDDIRAMSVSAFRLQAGDGRVLGVALTVVDVTKRHRAEGRLELLHRATGRIGTTLDVFRTAQELADVAAPGLADVAAVDVLDSVLYGEAPAAGPLLSEVTVRRAGLAPEPVWGAITAGEVRVMRYGTPYARALADLRPRLVQKLDLDETLRTSDSAYAHTLREAGAHSLMAVPLVARGVVSGMAAFFRTEGSPPFAEADLAVATDLVARAAVSVDNARRYTREQTVARLTQRTLVPTRLPVNLAVESAFTYLPVTPSGVWYDVILLSGARVALVAGEVSGHGMRAVTVMGRLRTAVMAFASMDLEPDELLERLHNVTEQLSGDHPPAPYESRSPASDGPPDDDGPELTATCLYVVYDPSDGSCELSRAGHPPPIVALPDGTVRIVESPDGSALGRGLPSYTATRLTLPEGSILALHNVGLLQRDPETVLACHRDALSRPAGTLQDTSDALAASLLPELPADDALLLLARTRVLGPDNLASWVLPGDPRSSAEARRLVTGRLTEWDLDDLAFTTALVASELVTNAIRYAEGPIELRLIRGGALICEVADSSGSAPHLRHALDDDEGGRGLYLVAQLTQGWGTRRAGRGKTIWAEQPIPSDG